MCRELRDAADALFALPIERKLALRPPTPEVNRGYSAKGSESLAYSLGAARPPDLFEAFNIGMDDNIWPDDVPAVRVAVERYFDELRPLIARIEAIIELALDLEPGFFAPRTNKSVDVLRLVRYEREAGEPDPSPTRCGWVSTPTTASSPRSSPIQGLGCRSSDRTASGST